MSDKILTPEERVEYDELLFEAGHDADGKPRPSHEIGARVVAMLREAAFQAQRPWAGYVLEDMAAAGALARWKKWNATREVVTVAGETFTTTKPAAMSVRRRDGESGKTYYQTTLWADMTRAQLAEIVDRTSKSIKTEQLTIATARRLLEVLDRAPTAQTVGEAMAELGTTTETYLAAVAA